MLIDIDKDPSFNLDKLTCDPAKIEEIRKLNETKDVFLCTDFLNPNDIESSGKICKERFNFLLATFPFIPPKRFIFTRVRDLFKEEFGLEKGEPRREKKVMLLDVDEVVWFSGFLRLINEFLGTDYKIDDFTDYYIDEVAIPKERFEEFKKFQSTRSLFENAKLLPKSVETIKRLSEEIDIYLYTDCIDPLDVSNSGRNYEDKFIELRRELPFISPDHFVFTGSKQILEGDIQIDDRLPNLDPSLPIRILFPSYHNRSVQDAELQEKGVLRAGTDWNEGWSEVERILSTYVEKPKQRL